MAFLPTLREWLSGSGESPLSESQPLLPLGASLPAPAASPGPAGPIATGLLSGKVMGAYPYIPPPPPLTSGVGTYTKARRDSMIAARCDELAQRILLTLLERYDGDGASAAIRLAAAQLASHAYDMAEAMIAEGQKRNP